MKLSEIKLAAGTTRLELTKSLGQNFLHDQNQVRRIVAAAEVGPADNVLEIGPGLGPLTALLVEQAGEVLAIEKDRRLFDFLTQKFSTAPNLKLVHADALEYLREHRRWGGWKLVANLPFSVASPLLVQLAAAAEPPQRLVVTCNWRSPSASSPPLAASITACWDCCCGLRFQAPGCFKIPASCFFPAPAVDSACIVLARRRRAAAAAGLAGETFAKLVKRGFSQRRKMMFKLLKQDWPEDTLRRAFDQAGLTPQTRAEEVSLEQFVRLTQIVSQ